MHKRPRRAAHWHRQMAETGGFTPRWLRYYPPRQAAAVDPRQDVSPGPTPAAVDRPGNLIRSGVRGVAWQGLAQAVSKTAVLLTTVILARLLTPGEFGLVSLSLVLITYAEAVADAGVAQALVYLPSTQALVRAALTCSVVTGLGLLTAAWGAAPAIASFFDRPDATALVRILALSLLAAALAALPEALLRRDLLFKRLTAATVLRGLASAAVSITLAFAGFGAWALAWGTVAGNLIYATAVWLLVPTRPDLRLWRTTRADVRQVLSYGMPVAGSSLLAKLIFDVDYLLIGRLLGATALGYYTLAFRLPELVILNVFFVLSTVAFPVYSRVRSDPERLRSGYLLSVRIYSLYGVCAGVGLAVVAPILVPAIFGPQWHRAVAPMVALALYASCRAIGMGANDIYKAIGRPGLSVSTSIARLVVLVPALTFGALHWGIVGVAWMQFWTSLAFAVFMQCLAIRILRLRMLELTRTIFPSALVGAAVAVVASSLARLPLAAGPSLVVVVLGGVAAALLALAVAQRQLLNELLSIARRRSVAAA